MLDSGLGSFVVCGMYIVLGIAARGATVHGPYGAPLVSSRRYRSSLRNVVRVGMVPRRRDVTRHP